MSATADTLSDVIHFYSYETGVSIELPVGFEEQSEQHHSVAYVDDPDDDSTPAARVLVQVVAELDADDAAAAQSAVDGLAHGFAAQGGEVLATRTETIDEVPTTTTLTRRTDPKLGGEWIFHQTAAAAEGRLISISALAPSADQARRLPEFDAAIRSIRFVQL